MTYKSTVTLVLDTDQVWDIWYAMWVAQGHLKGDGHSNWGARVHDLNEKYGNLYDLMHEADLDGPLIHAGAPKTLENL